MPCDVAVSAGRTRIRSKPKGNLLGLPLRARAVPPGNLGAIVPGLASKGQLYYRALVCANAYLLIF